MEERYRSPDDVIITDRLSERPSRAPDFAAENRVLQALATELAERPENLLQKLAETLVELSIADSAGISIEETVGVRQFRWVALAGVWAQFRWGTIPFDASPCGIAVERDKLLLVESPERFFPGANAEPLIHEGLLLPFHVGGRPVGTLWINAHNANRKFDREDVRLLQGLARFASAGYQMSLALRSAEAGRFESDSRRRANEKQRAFLLELSDSLRGLADPIAIEEQATRLLARQLDVSRVVYATFVVEGSCEYVVIEREHRAPGTPSLVGRHPAEASADDIDSLRAGRETVVPDTETEPMSEERRAGWRALGARARMGVPLVKEGRLVGVIGVQDTAPRAWSPEDVALVREVGERTWAAIERSRAEGALLKSEEKFRTVFETIDHAFVIQEIIRDEAGLAIDMRYVEINPAFTRQTGLGPEIVGKLVSEVMPDVERFFIDIHDRVARTGIPERFENYNRSTQRWYNAHITAIGGQGRLAASVFEDISARKLAEIALRESEERKAFLVELGDTLRPLDRAAAIKAAAIELLGRTLKADRVVYADVDNEHFEVGENFVSAGTHELVGRFPLSAFGKSAITLQAGQLVVAADVASGIFDDEEKANFLAVGVQAVLAVPLVKADRLIVNLSIHQQTPRHWRDDEIALVQETAERTWAAVERARAEAALRESEERQAFLLKLSDETRDMAEPEQIQQAASRLLGLHLNVSRVMYGVIQGAGDGAEIDIRGQFVQPTFSPFPDRFPYSAWASGFIEDLVAAGAPLVVDDVEADPRFNEAVRAQWKAMSVRSAIGVTLVKGGRPSVMFGLHHSQARSWNPEDIRLVTEVGERTWDASQRAVAEGALRASEERFQQFADASSGALWIRDAVTLKMEYVSPAISNIYGVDPGTFLNGVEVWASSIVPEDRDTALAHIEQARRGEAVVHEFRIQRASDQAFRWIRNTDFPLYDASGQIERIGGIAEDVTEVKLAIQHQGVLLAELQHRVRNIMAMIRSMALRSADGATSVEDYRSLLQGRLMALARVQVLLTREANAGGSLRDTIESEVAAQAHSGSQFELSGPDIRLSPKAVEVLTLAFHELATNALKYGAFSTPEGYLRVSWAVFEKRGRPWVGLDWSEQGAPQRPPPTRRGFGSDLIEGRIPYELGGTGKVAIEPGGAHCRLEFPLKDGESILETDAPTPTVVFGGVLDMTDAPSLAGRRVLVVEDDYYLAGDAAAALRGAGADVLGPCPSEEATEILLEETTPTHAVLDLNLGGGGPRFEIARAMRTRGVPFVFITGYDPDVIPPEFSDVTRLQKPVPFRSLVEAVSRL